MNNMEKMNYNKKLNYTSIKIKIIVVKQIGMNTNN